MAQTDLSASQINALLMVRGKGARNNHRRFLRYYVDECKSLKINPRKLTKYRLARRSLLHTMQHMFDERKRSVRTIADVKSAVSNLFHLRFPHKLKLAYDPVVQSLIASYYNQRPPIKKALHLKHTLQQFKDGMREQPPPSQLPTRILHGSATNFLLTFSGLRASESAQLDREATDPSPDGKTWKFPALIKQHHAVEEVVAHGHEETNLSTIAYLLEARRHAHLTGSSSRSFFIRDDGTKLSEACMRSAGMAALHKARLHDMTWYQLKHMASTFLVDSGAPPHKIRSQLHHKKDSNALLDHYVDWHNNEECARILAE
jgi:hypothetical protein